MQLPDKIRLNYSVSPKTRKNQGERNNGVNAYPNSIPSSQNEEQRTSAKTPQQ